MTDITIPAQTISVEIPAQVVALPPPEDPPPVATSAFYMPADAADLQAKWQAALDNGKLLMLSPDMDLAVPDTINLLARTGSGGKPHGVRSFGGRLNSAFDDWHKAIVEIRMGAALSFGMLASGLTFEGNFYTGKQCKAGLAIIVDKSIGSMYQFQVNDLVGSYCSHAALWLEGDIFEGMVDAPFINGCGDAGIICRMQPVLDNVNFPGLAGFPNGDVLSNVTIRTPNIRGGAGWGILCDGAKSVDVLAGGSFINNNLGGIWATQGIRHVDGPNFENCGPAAMRLDAAADGFSMITNCKGSNTLGAMQYLIDYRGAPAGLYQVGNSNYNGTVLKP